MWNARRRHATPSGPSAEPEWILFAGEDAGDEEGLKRGLESRNN